ERIGLATSGSAFRHGQMELSFPKTNHPITRGFDRLKLMDETYWNLRGDESRVHVLARAIEEGAPEVQLWAFEREKSRVFGCIPGHYTWTFDDPLYRVLVLRGIAWAAREPNVDRLLDLATVGARVAP
ncbi:MAG: ThuA domain-containing protein, partial [Chthoniobacteraceae bacterium]